jgi:DNA-binding Lrp family transcriptional regulator
MPTLRSLPVAVDLPSFFWQAIPKATACGARACPANLSRPLLREVFLVAAVVLIQAERDHIPRAARAIADIDGVAEVYSVAGDWDLIAILRVPEWEQIASVVTERLARVPGIVRTNTLVSFRVFSRKDLESAFDMFE